MTPTACPSEVLTNRTISQSPYLTLFEPLAINSKPVAPTPEEVVPTWYVLFLLNCPTDDFEAAEFMLALVLGLLVLVNFGNLGDRAGEAAGEPKNSIGDRVYVRNGFGEVMRVSFVGSRAFGRMWRCVGRSIFV